MLLIFTIFAYFTITYMSLVPYFHSLIGKSLFTVNKTNDITITLLFAWMFILPKQMLYFEQVLILYDQVIRHVARVCPNYIIINFNKSTSSLIPIIRQVDVSTLSLNQLLFAGICVRHAIRYENNLSELLETLLIAYNKKLEVYEKINNVNKLTLRSYNDEKLHRDTFINNTYKQNPVIFEFFKNKINQLIFGNTDNSLRKSVNDDEKTNIAQRSGLANDCDNSLRKSVNIVLLCSGGVDSMCIAHMLNDMKINFTALHFDWKKRLESTKEAAAVANYFAKNIKHAYFRIETYHGDKNDPCWDRQTTDFKTNILQMYDKNTYFLTGHIINDLVENFLMNALNINSKGSNVLTLFKMREISTISNCIIVRPLLLCEKFNANDVPHLEDNAVELTNKRRFYRKLLQNEFSPERIVQLYLQSEEVCEYFTNLKDVNNTPIICQQLHYTAKGIRKTLKQLKTENANSQRIKTK